MAIFMIGTQRSGSNLLRLMLNQLPDVAAPHPPHILQRMTPLLPSYGNLDKDENYMVLVEDICRLVELNPVPWEGVSFDREQIAARTSSRSLMAIMETVYDEVARVQGARTWCCKSLANVQYLPAIEKHFEEKARYIYLYRDGRDVALSFRKAIVGQKHFYHIAREWAQTQKLALTMESHIGPERFFRVKYEDMVEQPEAMMKSLCGFLGMDYRDDMLEFYQSTEAKNAAASSELWGNVTQPIIKGNTGKYRTEASDTDIRIFESVAGPVLDALGYERSVVRHGREDYYSAEQIKVFDAKNERLKRDIVSSSDDADKERRDKQSAFLASIETRQRAAGDEILSQL